MRAEGFRSGPLEGKSLDRKITPLLTDFYQLTMLGGYFQHRRHRIKTVFEYFFRSLPGEAGFALFAGLEDLAYRIENLRFGREEIGFLRGLKLFKPDFLEALRAFRFSGDIDAVPEGTVVFPNEPLVRVRGPLWEAQLLETLLLNSLNYPTLVASKAARICLTARPDPVLEFGLRRAQGPNGGLCGSRAAFIGGCAATSNVEAGRRYGIPVRGTHAHSWIMSYPDELSAFRAYLATYPDAPTLLVDTYDTAKSGVPNAVRAFSELRERGWQGRAAVRIDSGDLAADSITAHQCFLEAGFRDPLIIASNDLDEYLIADLKRQGARINAWGVGTNLITCQEAPALTGVYKLAAVCRKSGWESRIKISGNPDKTTDPGIKNPLRYAEGRRFVGDILFSTRESAPLKGPVAGVNRVLLYRHRRWGPQVRGKKLLKPLFRKGKPVGALPGLDRARALAKVQIEHLSPETLRLRNPDIYPVLLSEALAGTKARCLERPDRAYKLHSKKGHNLS
jgi:nicotinate phosphoribosyltransferase